MSCKNVETEGLEKYFRSKTKFYIISGVEEANLLSLVFARYGSRDRKNFLDSLPHSLARFKTRAFRRQKICVKLCFNISGETLFSCKFLHILFTFFLQSSVLCVCLMKVHFNLLDKKNNTDFLLTRLNG